jgi:hypothetical protein
MSHLWMPDLGARRGALSDWVTQRWVQATGRRVDLAEHAWLEGPVGDVRRIGSDFFDRLAAREGLTMKAAGTACGLIPNFKEIDSPHCRVAALHPAVGDFYERASEFDLDVWSNWCGALRPFGSALAVLFSRRLQQLNVPLDPLETSGGMRSQIVQLLDPATGRLKYTAWVRDLIATEQTLYAGAYSLCRVPGHDAPCVKVVFPLPNGSAIVFMTAKAEADGSLTLRSLGTRFGDPGFYFYVASSNRHGWARHVRTMRETIRVFVDRQNELRATHDLEIWGTTFLQLHYRMRQRHSRG